MKTRLRFLLLLASPILLRTGFTTAEAQVGALAKPSLNASSGTAAGLPTNSISHLTVKGSDLWLGTGKGLARTTDGGLTFSSFRNVPQFPTQSVFSLDIHGQAIWCGTGYTKDVQDASVQTGTGYAYSTDYGSTWHTAPQPLDGRGTVSLSMASIPSVFSLLWYRNKRYLRPRRHRQCCVGGKLVERTEEIDRQWPDVEADRPSFANAKLCFSRRYAGRICREPLLDNNFLLFSVYPRPVTSSGRDRRGE